MDLDIWHSQLRKGAAELLLLATLRDGEAYGLEILQRINKHGDVVADGAIYPLLNRLEKSGRIKARWSIGEESNNPRKYYKLTADGRAALGEMSKSWTAFRSTIDAVIGE